MSKISYWGYYEILTQVQTKIGGGAVPWECLPVSWDPGIMIQGPRLTRLVRLSCSQEGVKSIQPVHVILFPNKLRFNCITFSYHTRL